jgi:hypothetical protein
MLMDFNGDLEEVVSMWGDTLFRLVEDGGLFLIDRSSKGDSSDCCIAVENKAAVMVVLSSYVRMIGVGVMTRFPGRLRHQGAFDTNGTIKVEKIGLLGFVASGLAKFLKVGMESGRYSATQNIVRCVIVVSLSDGSTELPHIMYSVRNEDVSTDLG